MASTAYTLAAKAAHMLLVPFDAFATANALGEGEDPTLPPGSPPTRTFEGPWFQTQLTISCALGAYDAGVGRLSRTDRVCRLLVLHHILVLQDTMAHTICAED